jgi:hypothetical protein
VAARFAELKRRTDERMTLLWTDPIEVVAAHTESCEFAQAHFLSSARGRCGRFLHCGALKLCALFAI